MPRRRLECVFGTNRPQQASPKADFWVRWAAREAGETGKKTQKKKQKGANFVSIIHRQTRDQTTSSHRNAAERGALPLHAADTLNSCSLRKTTERAGNRTVANVAWAGVAWLRHVQRHQKEPLFYFTFKDWPLHLFVCSHNQQSVPQWRGCLDLIERRLCRFCRSASLVPYLSICCWSLSLVLWL